MKKHHLKKIKSEFVIKLYVKFNLKNHVCFVHIIVVLYVYSIKFIIVGGPCFVRTYR